MFKWLLHCNYCIFYDNGQYYRHCLSFSFWTFRTCMGSRKTFHRPNWMLWDCLVFHIEQSGTVIQSWKTNKSISKQVFMFTFRALHLLDTCIQWHCTPLYILNLLEHTTYLFKYAAWSEKVMKKGLQRNRF